MLRKVVSQCDLTGVYIGSADQKCACNEIVFKPAQRVPVSIKQDTSQGASLLAPCTIP